MILNLPVDLEYDPTNPWVYRFNSVTLYMYSFFKTCIYDIRTESYINKSCGDTSLQVAVEVNKLGQHDVSRKRRAPGKRPVAWAGEM